MKKRILESFMGKSLRRIGLSLGMLLLGSLKLFAAEAPNILWITSEDNGVSWVSCYGGVNCKTPAIDQLAREGFRYTHCFDNAAVCAPTRSTWITGLYAISMGTQPMRSRNAIPHDRIQYYPDLLREAGYHVGNSGKTDYNIGSRPDKECWEGGGKWKLRKPSQPFFYVQNIGASHESNAFPRKTSVRTDPAKMVLHAYHPDLPEVRQTYARYADAVERMDGKVQEIIDQLKEDGLYEDTIIVYNSDHAGVMPRSKRFLYSSGIHCPLIVRIPEKWKRWWPAAEPGMTVDRIVSFVDMPKTWLSLAGAEVPTTYQGTVFLGDHVEQAQAYHLSFRERADEAFDMVRGMRNKRFAYIKNYMPWAPNGQRLRYMWTMTGMQAWERHYLEGKTNAITGRFFRSRVSEEFYDTHEDFDNVNNLIDDPQYQAKIDELRMAMRDKQLKLYDSGLLPEGMRLKRAKENNLTIYEMVRNPKLYPLEKYLDFADLALSREAKNLPLFTKVVDDADEGMRYWAICGLFLLGDDAAAAVPAMERALEDDAEEVKLMAAWALHRLGFERKAQACFDAHARVKGRDKRLLQCVGRWMNPAGPERG
ncbi:MAG: sulfatase-like hydrolase/transferase [Pirellulales bacterium]|nr:sulfatase-like hydrolase/transferase [Pirellulales bacterium]